MADLAARDLMVPVFQTVGRGQNVRAAIALLLARRLEGGQSQVLPVLDEDGTFLGLLSTRALFQDLVARWIPDESVLANGGDKEDLEDRLFDLGPEFLAQQVDAVMDDSVAAAHPADRLPRLMELAVAQHLDALPVVEEGKLRGVVPVVELFQKVAALTLTPEDEGIRLERA